MCKVCSCIMGTQVLLCPISNRIQNYRIVFYNAPTSRIRSFIGPMHNIQLTGIAIKSAGRLGWFRGFDANIDRADANIQSEIDAIISRDGAIIRIVPMRTFIEPIRSFLRSLLANIYRVAAFIEKSRYGHSSGRCNIIVSWYQGYHDIRF